MQIRGIVRGEINILCCCKIPLRGNHVDGSSMARTVIFIPGHSQLAVARPVVYAKFPTRKFLFLCTCCVLFYLCHVCIYIYIYIFFQEDTECDTGERIWDEGEGGRRERESEECL